MKRNGISSLSRVFGVLLAAIALVFASAIVATGTAAAPNAPSSVAPSPTIPAVTRVAAALARYPVYVDPAADSWRIDAAQIKAVLPDNTYLAVLPAAPANTQPDELPALVSGGVGRGGTFVLLLGGRFYGASTTLPGQLTDDLATAQHALPSAGSDATGTITSLMRSLSGSADLHDAAGPSRAGGPVGANVLIAIVIALAVGVLTLWWWLRRKPAAHRPQRVPRRRDLVEIDHEGTIIKRTPAAEREP